MAELVKGYERVKMMSAFLFTVDFTVDEARCESPAVRFETEPRFADWW